MMVDVHLSQGRIVLRLMSRGQMIKLIQRDPAQLDESQTIKCWIDYGQGEGFQPTRGLFVKKHSIAFVRQVEHEERTAFLAEHAPQLLERRAVEEAVAVGSAQEGQP